MSRAVPAGTWFAPACPSWCDGRHAAILTDDDPDEFGENTIVHGRELINVDGLAVELCQYQEHPTAGTAPTAAALFVYLDESATSDQLRSWATALTAAADTADELTREAKP